MNIRITVLLLIILSGCQSDSTEKTYNPTKYSDDIRNLKLEQVSTSPDHRSFIGIFYDEGKSLSGRKIIKLYGTDSMSVDEAYYGAHPLEVYKWVDSVIILDAGVFSAHGDSTYRKLYLDGSVDRNKTLGNFKVKYQKHNNYEPK
jgi:hypothetical protein